jgi:hypothetical protein
LLETSAAGLADVSVGCALADVASRLIANTARVPIVIVFRDIPIPFPVTQTAAQDCKGSLDWGAKLPQSETELIAPIAIAVAIIMRPRIIVVSRISVGPVMKIPKGTMIGAVLTTTIKTVFVSPFVRVRQLVVEPIVSAITVVFIIVSKCGHHRYGQQYDGSH